MHTTLTEALAKVVKLDGRCTLRIDTRTISGEIDLGSSYAEKLQDGQQVRVQINLLPQIKEAAKL